MWSRTLSAVLFAMLCLPDALIAQTDGIFRSTFLANEGQWPKEILYKGRSANANVSFLQDGVSFSQVDPEAEAHEHEEHGEDAEHEEHEKDHHAEPDFIVWNMHFEGASTGMLVRGEGGRPSVTSYFSTSDRSRWVVHPKEYDRVDYIGVYPGIDAHFRMEGDDLKYDHVVHAGADPSHIRIRYDGVQGLAVDADGDLIVHTAYGDQRQQRPMSWQVIDGERRIVKVSFVLIDASTFGFRVNGGYDRTHDLVIDPLFEMVWASYTRALGGSNNINYSFANAMDAQGNVYLTGYVDGTFPVTPGAYSGPGNVYPDIFVSKFSSDGSTLLYSTYLPANSSEFGSSIAVDELGRAYVTGEIDLNITGITDFPSTANAYQTVVSEGPDAFLTVLSPGGDALEYSSFLGGIGGEVGYGVALGPTGIAYITGTTTYQGFPVVNATSYPDGQRDAFVAKFDINQSGAASLVYAARIGDGDFAQCSAHGIAVDAEGNAYVTGTVSLGFGTSAFPVTPGAYNTAYQSEGDVGMAYLFKLGASLPATIEYCTFLGPGTGTSVAAHPTTGEAFVSGTTYVAGFPVTPGALQATHGGATDAFVLRMNAAGNALIYSTFLGGPGYDESTDIVANSANEAYVAGIARGGFPTSTDALQPQNANALSPDVWVVQLNSSGTGYGCGGSTYFGGTADEYYGSFYDFLAPSISLQDNGGYQDTLSINATSHSEDLPTTAGVYEPTKVNGIADQPFFFKLTCAAMPMAPNADLDAQADPNCTAYLFDFTDGSTSGATSWNWTFQSGTPGTSTAQDPQDIAFPGPGTYAITLVACNDIGCDTVTQQITVDPIVPITVDLGNDTLICPGGAAMLDAGAGASAYTWSLDGSPIAGSGPTQLVTAGGLYSVVVQNDDGCQGSDTVLVSVLPALDPLFTHAVQVVPCGSTSVVFQAAGEAGQYLWDLGDGSVGSGGTLAHFYDSAGTYLITLTVIDGPCDSTSSSLVEVPGSTVAGYAPGPVPNVFTPNGDGRNDVFLPLGANSPSGCATLLIMNRWGQEMRGEADAALGWNGATDDHDPAPDGVYYFILAFGEQRATGYVELLR